MTKLYKVRTRIAAVIACLFTTFYSSAQVDVTASAGTATASYTTLGAAFSAINAGTHQGVINIALTGNTTETTTALLSASGTGSSSYTSVTVYPAASAAVTISGAVTAGTPLIDLNGADNVVFDGLNTGGNTLTIVNTTVSGTSGTSTIRLIGGATNNTITRCTVMGSFSAAVGTNGGNIFFSTDANTTNGNDNNSITNCNITSGSGLTTKGIYSNGSTSTSALYNSGNLVSGNDIYDYFGAAVSSAGVYLAGGNSDWTISNNKFYQTAPRTQTSGAQHSAIWINYSSGNNFAVTGNIIGYGSNAGTGIYSFAGVSSSSVLIPIYLNVGTTTATSVQGNTIAGISMSGAVSGTSSSASFRGIYVSSGLTTIGDVTGNIIGSQTSTGSITFTSTSPSSADIYGIFNFGSSNWVTDNNTIGGIIASNSSTGAANIYGIRCFTGSAVTWVCNNNIVGGTVSNSIQSTSTATGTVVVGILNSSPIGTITDNIVRNLTTAGGTGTGAAASISGIANTSGSNQTISGNTISNLNGTGASNISGISITNGATNNIFNNKLYNITENNAGGIVYGISISGGTTTNVYNNLIGDLSSSAFTSATSPYLGLAGLNITGGTTVNAYYNTIYIGSVTSSGANYTTAGIFASVTPSVLLQNNLVVNLATPTGSGKAVAYERNGTSLSTYLAASNKNSFYAGTPGANNVIYWDGTTTAQDMASYIALMATRDQSSVTVNPTFLSTTGSAANYLHIDPSVPTVLESGGLSVAGITTDYDGNIRFGNAGYTGTGTAPDIGADEFEGTTPAPSITLTSFTPGTASQCVKSNRTVVVDVTTASGTITGVTLNYSYNGVPQTPVAMTNTTGNSWTGTIVAPATGNENVAWTVIATNSLGISTTYNGTGYADEPTSGIAATATASNSTICAGASTDLSVAFTNSGSITLGSGASTSSSSGSSFFPGGWGGAKTQYLIRASELTAAGLSAGNITSLGFEPTTSGQTYTGFSVSMAQTALTVLTSSAFVNTGLSQVYLATGTDNGYTPVAGNVNTLSFGTGAGSSSSFAWNGTSNIIVSISWSSVPSATTSTSTSMKVDAPGFTCTAYDLADSQTPAAMLASTTPDGTGTQRPKFYIAGNVVPTPTAFSWSDGSIVVGTTNPVTVNPATNTSYTATSTILGCPVVSNAVAITVNPLPMAPVTAGSAQCGTQIPSATVTSNAGSNGSGVFNWYAASTGGTALQSSTSTTYQSTVSSTTTFYVSETGTNGCESGRTAVTVTVGAAPALTLNTNTTDFCVGATSSTITVTSNTADFNSYVWSPATNVTGDVNSGWTFNPTATTTYTLTGNNSSTGCSNVATLTVTVNPLPLISSLTASVNPVCAGSSTTISAASIPSATGTATVGSGATTASSYSNPFYSLWSNTQQQILVRASELSAAGLVAGNITALTLTVNSGTTILPDFSLSMQHTSQTALSTLTSSGWSTVYTNPTGYTPVVGANTITFASPFNWDGTSNVLLKFCWGNNGSTSTVSSTVVADNTPYVSGLNAHNTSSTSGSSICSSTTLFSTYSSRPKMTFSGQVGTNLTSTLNWVWSPAAGLSATTGSTVTATPANTTVYTVTATDPSTTCSASQNITITVNPVPLSPVSGNITQCGTAVPNPAVNYVSDPNSFTSFTYNWYTASTGGTAVLSSSDATASPSLAIGSNTFYVSIINTLTGCESARTTVVIDVTAPPALTLSSSTVTICDGTSAAVSLTAGSADYDSFVWSPASNVTGNSTSGWSLNPSATSSYTLSAASTVTGCQNTTSLTVNVNPAPTAVVVTPTSGSVCVNGVIPMSATGGVVSGSSSLSSGSVNLAIPDNSTTGITSTINVTSLPPGATLTGISVNLNITHTFDGDLDISLTGPNGTTIDLSSDNGSSGNDFVNTTLSSSATTSITTGVAPMTGTFLPEGNLSQLYSVAGGNWVLSIVDDASGDIGVLQNWSITLYYDYNNIVWSPVTDLFTDAAATIPYAGENVLSVYAKPSVAGAVTYTATSTNSVSCTATASTTITVNPLPSVMAMASSVAVCDGGSVTLSGMGANTYTWTGGVSDGVAFTPAGTATYTVTGTDINGCVNTATAMITVNPLPVVDLGADIIACGSATLDAGNAGSDYMWSDMSISQTLTVISSGTYSVTVTDPSTSCTGTDAIDVTINALPVVNLGSDIVQCGGTATLDAGNAGASYVWSDLSTAQTLTVSVSGTYSVTVTDATTSCTGTDAIDVTINSLPVVDLGADIIACGSATLDAGNAGASYVWNDLSTSQTLTVTTSATYSVTVTDASTSCTNSDMINVTINALPSVTMAAFASPVCDNGGAVTLTGGSPAGGVYSGTAVSGGMFDPTGLAGAYLITYTVTDVNSCSNSDTATVMVDICEGIASSVDHDQMISIYPNPTNGMFNISISNASFSQLSISIVDITGKEVYNDVNKITSNYNKQIDLEGFAKGVYYIKMNTGDDLKIQKLVIH